MTVILDTESICIKDARNFFIYVHVYTKCETNMQKLITIWVKLILNC